MSLRDPANSLFDSGCELLDAARILTVQLARGGHEEALPATFGCLEESFRELARAHAELRTGQVPLAAALERVVQAMTEAERACAAARVAAGLRSGVTR